MNNNKVVIIGAGKTGRGYLARLMEESGIRVYFVDKDAALVEKLNELKSFSIHFFGKVREDLLINGYEAHTWEYAQIADAGLILVSVGGTNLKDVGNMLAKKLEDGRHYNIITCENSSKPSEVLKQAIGSGKNVSVSESTVFCTTIESISENSSAGSNGSEQDAAQNKQILDINSENYPYLQCNADLLKDYPDEIPGIRPIKNFGNFLTRKLYTYNAASCVIAYLGFLKGYTDYRDAGNDPEILQKLDENYRISNQVLCEEFGYDPADQEEFARLSRDKFTSRVIVDTVDRNAREPQRKLADRERIIGPMKLIYAHGIMPEVLIETAGAALHYDKGDAWLKIKAENTPEEILEKICGLEKDGVLYTKVLEAYHRQCL